MICQSESYRERVKVNHAIVECRVIYLYFFFYLTLILLRLFQQHYCCYNVTGQSQESEGSCKPARIKEVHSKLHSFREPFMFYRNLEIPIRV